MGGSWHVKRILGTVPVQADGSAAFRIPAERRVFFQPLDERGRAAGGLELCGKPVWTGRDAPAYQAALRVVQAWHDDLVAHPREDMPGFTPCDAYAATQSKRQAWLQIEAANRRK